MSSPASPDPDARPRSLAQRLGLLCILLLLPVAAVALPTVVITHFFGQRPTPKTTAAPTPDASGFRQELDRKASQLLPAPAPLTGAPIRVSVHDPSHVGPRTEKIAAQARAFGGASVEGVAVAGERHLFVDLPPGRADAFRTAVLENWSPDVPIPPARPTASSTRDQVEVFVRAAANDE